jgi:hypothetical protein
MTIKIPDSYNQFINHHKVTDPEDTQLCYLKLVREPDGLANFNVVRELDGDISNCALEALKGLNELMVRYQARKDLCSKYVALADAVFEEYESVQEHRGFFGRIWNAILVALDLRTSKQALQVQMFKIYRKIPQAPAIQPAAPQAPQLQVDDTVKRSDTEKEKHFLESSTHDEKKWDRIEKHRGAGTKENIDKYKNDQLDKAQNDRWAQLLNENKEKLAGLKDPAAKRVFEVKLKEQACKEVYESKMNGNIEKGYYDPEIIFDEIEINLGLRRPVPDDLTANNLNKHLGDEIKTYVGLSKINRSQATNIKEVILKTVELYRKVYPKKSLEEVFRFAQDLIRFSVYQEIYDKASFSGSDHGSKHIHHNIDNAEGINGGINAEDKTDKDRLMERLVHIFHDVGYTTGLSGKSFDCSKDHPFIGAKMIDLNREYFMKYLDDKETVDVLRDCILYHAICSVNFDPKDVKGEGIQKMHPSMIRAVTSVSDACAVTFDRKTQEFWEQPACLIALSRLRLFLAQFPQYTLRMANREKFLGEAVKSDNPLDKVAGEVLSHTLSELFQAVDNFKYVDEDKKGLFRQAITEQFNSFTTIKTFDQYGAVLERVSAEQEEPTAGGPKYLPLIVIAPSILYGLLYGLYGEEQAQGGIKKLLEEFGADIKKIKPALELAVKKKLQKAEKIKDGCCHAQVVNMHEHEFHVPPEDQFKTLDAHAIELHAKVAEFADNLNKIYDASQVFSWSKRDQALKELKAFRKAAPPVGVPDTLGAFVQSHIMNQLPVKPPGSPEGITIGLNQFTELVKTVNMGEIRKVDQEWEALMAPLTLFQKLGKPLKEYQDGLAALKTKLDDQVAVAKLRDNLLKAANPPALTPEEKAKLEGVIQKIHGELEKPDFQQRIKENEQTFIKIENALRMAMITDAEYNYMMGGQEVLQKPKVKMVELLVK